MKKGIFILSLWLFVLPSFAFAATTHVFTCADFTLTGGATCTGTGTAINLSIPNSGSASAYDAAPIINLWGGSWYITGQVSPGAIGTGKIDCAGSCGSASNNFFTGSFTDQLVPFTLGGGPSGGLDIYNNANSFNGSFTYLCESDTAGQCVPPAPVNPDGGVDPCVASFGTTTSSVATSTGCTVQVIDYPMLDVFMGVVVFLLCAGWTARYFNSQIHG